MAYSEITELFKILEQKCKEIDNFIRPGGTKKEFDGKPYNLYYIFGKSDINVRSNMLENQSNESEQKMVEPNRFIEDFFVGTDERKANNFNEAVGNLRIKPITQAQFNKMLEIQQKRIEKLLLKNIVISTAQLLNATNRMPRIEAVYSLKDRLIADYLAYAEMFNAKYPDEKMAFGFIPDDTGVATLNASIPGYSRFSVHLGRPVKAANILFEANEKMLDVAPKIGFIYSPRLARTIQQKSIKYVKYGEYELTDKDDPINRLKTYNLTQIRRKYIDRTNTRKQLPSGPLSDSDKSVMDLYDGYLLDEIYNFILQHEYPLQIHALNTGMVNCYDGNGVSRYSNFLKGIKDDFEVDVAFNMIFASNNFNKREQMYIAERAGLPLHILEKIDRMPIVILEEKDGESVEEKAINSFLKRKTINMDEQGKIDFIKKVLAVYNHYGKYAVEEKRNFLQNINSSNINVKEEDINDLQIEEMLKEYRECKDESDDDLRDLLEDEEWTTSFMTALSKSNSVNKVLTTMEIQDIIEILQTIDDTLDLGEFSTAFSQKIKSLSKEELKKVFITEEFEMFRFEKVLKSVDIDTKKTLLESTIGIVREELGDDSIVRETIEGMDADDSEIEETLNLYDQMKSILDQTTIDSRREAAEIEDKLESKNIGDAKEQGGHNE